MVDQLEERRGDEPWLAQPWPDCVVPRADAPDVRRRIKSALGFVPRSVEFTGCVPWMAEIDRLATIPPLRALDRETADLGALAGAHATSCRHCYGATHAAMLLLGYPEARVAALRDRSYGAGVSPRLQAGAEL